MEKIIKETAEIEHNGEKYSAEWVTFLHDGKEMNDRWMKIFKSTTGGLIAVTGDSATREVSKALSAAKCLQLREEYNISSPETDNIQIAEHIIRRSWNGEWMAQHNSWFYIDNLAEIFGTTFGAAAQMVADLTEKKVVGLNGFIIIPWEQAEETRYKLEVQSGHRMLELSDWGGWSCGHCYKNSDERGPAASEVECVPPDFTLGRPQN